MKYYTHKQAERNQKRRLLTIINGTNDIYILNIMRDGFVVQGNRCKLEIDYYRKLTSPTPLDIDDYKHALQELKSITGFINICTEKIKNLTATQ